MLGEDRLPGCQDGLVHRVTRNDPAIAISWLLAAGADRAAYVDIDAHHGDGVQDAFFNDPRVLTISVHEDPAGRPPADGGCRGRDAAAGGHLAGQVRAAPLPFDRAGGSVMTATSLGSDMVCSPGPCGIPTRSGT